MFKSWPKIPRLENEVYHITEKIDGTNACVVIQHRSDMNRGVWETMPLVEIEGFGIWAQSRTRLITPEEDNYGFAKWVQDNAEQLIKDLGEGYHFGEWWGRGINRGYGIEDRRFSLFNPTKHSEVCYNIPSIFSGNHLLGLVSASKAELSEKGSLAVPGYMKPEGLVVYAEKAKCYWKVVIDK